MREAQALPEEGQTCSFTRLHGAGGTSYSRLLSSALGQFSASQVHTRLEGKHIIICTRCRGSAVFMGVVALGEVNSKEVGVVSKLELLLGESHTCARIPLSLFMDRVSFDACGSICDINGCPPRPTSTRATLSLS